MKLAVKKLVEDARAILNKADAEKRQMTAEERQAWDKIMADVDAQSAAIEQRERLEAADKAAILADEAAGKGRRFEFDNDETREQAIESAFGRLLRRNTTAEDLALLDEYRASMSTSGTTAGAGYFIPQGFSNTLEQALLAYGGMLDAATVITTDSGNLMYMPTVNDTAQSGTMKNELSALSATGATYPTFSREQLEAYDMTTDVLRVSWAMLQDSAFDLAGYIAQWSGVRLARLINTYATTGTGSSQPEGAVGGATSSHTAASSSALTADDILTLYHSIDPLYRVGPKVRFMFNDTTFLALRKLKDGNGQYIWEPGLKAGEPATILGKPFTVNQAMANIGSAAKPVLFGDFSKVVIRRVGTPALVVLDQLYALTRETGYFMWQRMDSVVTDAGTHPLKYITCAS